MSSAAGINYSELLALYQENFVSNCAQVAVAAALAFEYALTVEQGIRILRGKKTATFWLFLLNQLVMVGLVVTNVLEMVPWTSSSYSSVMVTYISTGVPGLTFCDPISHFSMAFDKRALIASRTCAIAGDVLVLLTTWYHAPRPAATLKRAFGSKMHTPFVVLLLRDGAFYFMYVPEWLDRCPLILIESASVLLLITVAQIVVNNIEALSIGTVFLVPAMSVLVSRFLLDIYEAAEDAGQPSDRDFDSSTHYTLNTGIEFQMGDLECMDATIATNEIYSFPSHFTDSGLG
ncbi:uncharacterized protein C8Q71DRAFT_727264 [Rhodofomes roseus]|uniref:Uncharacterized protein n=1 Tax=Rhodofomes roseus TaxID=34475 RepID=A0ABQ8K265_9APHY|nr:uncharacterized protein C8Q71DRAFT_727264 [Rhodofomes roseus]KAH9830793.1 hypothetical protein C8Q71DRAFT_727264 [Rhodofomes roseus]